MTLNTLEKYFFNDKILDYELQRIITTAFA